MDNIDLFVPGRLCLFGEHSDWAGGHRRQNSELEKGYAIVAPTNQGNYGHAKRIDKNKLVFNSKIFGKLEMDLREEDLLKIATEGGTFSYVAGVAHEVITSYNSHHEGGLEIDNYRTTLPVKKGLSSSASICVLVARAFNELYELKWKPKRLMEIAYTGEITTPSRCGRLDQACAYSNSILMGFDGDGLDIEELKVGKDLPLLIVNLKGEKNTVRILSRLSQGFPFATNETERRKHEYFRTNKVIVSDAVNAIENGDFYMLGELMKKAQKKFDEYLAPACPEDLEAPKLHYVLHMPEIQNFIYGGKGVGSQGDGSAQFVCKSNESRDEASRILGLEGFECINLDIKKH